MNADARPRKRAAFEPAARLAQPVAHDPHMRRPVTTVAGSVLVMLRVAAGVLWMLAVVADWESVARGVRLSVDGVDLTADDLRWGLGAFLAVVGASLLVDLGFAVFILRGHNWARVIVMVFSTISIGSSFVAWWAQGQEVRIGTTLLTVAFDILVLLALSSRSAAAYARRNERR